MNVEKNVSPDGDGNYPGTCVMFTSGYKERRFITLYIKFYCLRISFIQNKRNELFI